MALHNITAPPAEYDGPGDALHAMELALSLEKLNFQKLRALHDVAFKHGDAQMCDFVKTELLAAQVRGRMPQRGCVLCSRWRIANALSP